MLSIVIPARNEPHLGKTVSDLLAKCSEEIEIIVILDGCWPTEFNSDKRVTYVHFSNSRGMRNAINSGAALAHGEYLMKIDAHCMVEKGFDVVLKTDIKPDWVVVPRRKRLDPVNWTNIEDGRPPIDYMYLTYPGEKFEIGLHGAEWRSRNSDLKLREKLIDNLLSFQGSCWFMKRDYFYELELMDEANYGGFASEAQEIGFKAWLSGGSVMVNKKTCYSHWHKDEGRGYSLSKNEFVKGSDYANRWFKEKKIWHKQIHSLKWLIEKFSPIPGWPQELNWPATSTN